MKTFLTKFLLPFLAFVAVVSFVAAPLAESIGINQVAVTAALVVGAFAYHVISAPSPNTGMQLNGVEVELWANYLVERFWKDNKFFQFMFSDDDKVLAGKVVHIPNPGAKPTVVKNRLNYPAAAVRRSDTDIVYTLNEYTTNPTHISDAEKVEPSYDKIDSVYGDHAGSLNEDVAGDALVIYLNGLPQTALLKTTGSATSDNRTGLTGNRKKFTLADLKKAMRKFDQDNVPSQERYALLSAQMYDELMDDLIATQYRDFSQVVDPKTGIIGVPLMGFNIMKRSDIALGYDSGGGVLVPRAYGAAAQSGDRDMSIIWQKNSLTRALGEVKFFDNPDRAEYYGDVYSALLRFGGRRRREDNLGVIGIIQDTAA